jgi:hypothetical protein
MSVYVWSVDKASDFEGTGSVSNDIAARRN